MLKRTMLALAFVGAIVIGSLGVTSSAQAYHGHGHGHCHDGGGFYRVGYYGGGYPVGYPAFRRAYYASYAPRYSAYSHRFGLRNRYHDHYDYDCYAPRSGFSLYIGN